MDALLDGLQNHENRRPDNNRGGNVKAPTYDGTTDVRKFLQTFNEVANHHDWTREQRALRMKLSLKSTAADCVQGDDYESMAESLLHRFECSMEQARSQLRSLKLRPGDDIHQFGNLVMKLVKVADPDLEDEALDDRATAELVDAIGDKTLTREFRLVRAVNFADAIRRIQQYQNDLGSSKLRRVETDQPEDDGLKKLEFMMKEMMTTLTDAIGKVEEKQTRQQNELDDLRKTQATTRNVRDSRPQSNYRNNNNYQPRPNYNTPPQRHSNNQLRNQQMTCFNCQRPGHLSRECRQPRRNFNPTQQSGNGRGPQ